MEASLSGGALHGKFEGLAQDPESEDDDFVEEQLAHWIRTRNMYEQEAKRKAADTPQNKDDDRARLRRRLVKQEEEEEAGEEEDVGPSTAPRSRLNLRARQRRSLLYDNEDEDNDGDDDDDYQDSRSHVGTSTTSSRSRRFERDEGDDVWYSRSYSDDDPRDNNYLEETEIGGTSSNTLTEASVSNQYVEMLGKGAKFGMPYLPHRVQKRPTLRPNKHLSNSSDDPNDNDSDDDLRGDYDDGDDSSADSESSDDDDSPDVELGFAMNTRVFMADGNTKRIKNIQPGDTVLEPDRLPRRVIGISAGRSHLVEVHELTAHINHLPHDYMGLITFSCSPGQVYI
ncbi:hypothetical protein CPC16_007396 [Podila verticillata]|nr:hypothetical protein CPC16_007396 [Podila verticillata]